jgi:hypothetical protein
VAELFHLVEVFERAVAFDDLVEHFQQAARADAARVHLPQLSSTVNSRKNRAMSTMQCPRP